LGVEDDGTPTGLHAEHRMLGGLPGLVAARTSPSVNVTVQALEVDGVSVARIAVPKARSVVATSGGVYLRRRIRHDGQPECVPMLPHERESRASTLGLVDVSALPVAGATLADLDPLERERLRQAVQQYGGDRVLLELDDEALDGALGLTVREPDSSRVPVPTVDMAAFRGAVANALIHRDYHRLGAVHVRLEDDALVVSNPGGLVEGVTLANLLVTEPRPRNRALADAMKRIGVVERSGRGVDTIYRGMLKFGRPAPDYTRTDAHNVVVRLPTEPADLDFRRLVAEEARRRGAELPIDRLIALAALRELKRVTADELAGRIQRDAASAKRTLEALIEAGLVEAHGAARGRSYTLSAAVYQRRGEKAAYTRQAGFTPIQHEQMVLNYVRQHGQIRRAEVMDLCRLSE